MAQRLKKVKIGVKANPQALLLGSFVVCNHYILILTTFFGPDHPYTSPNPIFTPLSLITSLVPSHITQFSD